MFRKFLRLSCFLFPAMLAAAGPQALFNGKNLEGWTFDVIDPEVKPEAVWSVTDGLLVCKGRPPGVIRTTRGDFSNYELTVEWPCGRASAPQNGHRTSVHRYCLDACASRAEHGRGGVSGNAKPGNSGVLVHASKPREMFVWPKSVEVQLGTGNAGDFWTIGEKLTVPGASPQGRRWLKRQESTENPPGEWNILRVRCEERKLTVWVNGTLMNEAEGLSTDKGAICLQSEGAPIHFRKVELVPIKR